MGSLNSNLNGLHLLMKENILRKDSHIVTFPFGSVPGCPKKDNISAPFLEAFTFLCHGNRTACEPVTKPSFSVSVNRSHTQLALSVSTLENKIVFHCFPLTT